MGQGERSVAVDKVERSLTDEAEPQGHARRPGRAEEQTPSCRVDV